MFNKNQLYRIEDTLFRIETKIDGMDKGFGFILESFIALENDVDEFMNRMRAANVIKRKYTKSGPIKTHNIGLDGKPVDLTINKQKKFKVPTAKRKYVKSGKYSKKNN